MESRLGIDIPIIQSPMAGTQDWELALAVSEAGGLGSIPCGMLGPEQVKTEIESYLARSSRPYNLNYFCHRMPAADIRRMSAWEKRLAAYYRELDVRPPSGEGPLRLPFDSQMADLIEPYAPPVLSFHFGLPAPELVRRIKSWGSVILSSATTIEEGYWLEANGADLVIAQGYEAGGHRGMFLTADISAQMGTFALVSQLANRLKVPVVAAGGISSCRDVRAMLHLGAAGVQAGTSYLLCTEAKTGPLHRAALKDPERKTAITNIFSGRPARSIRNRIMEELGDVCEAAPEFPYSSIALAPLRREAESFSSSDFTPLWAGQNRSGCRETPAGPLTKALWNGC